MTIGTEMVVSLFLSFLSPGGVITDGKPKKSSKLCQGEERRIRRTDAPNGLEDDLPYGAKQDCRVMVAAQYILLAGRTMADDCFNKPIAGFGPEQWRCWVGKLKEISMQEGNNTSLALALEQGGNSRFGSV